MKTLESIIERLTSPAILDGLADLLRSKEPEFAVIEENYHAAVKILCAKRDPEIEPTTEAFITACKRTAVAKLLYAAYLGYKTNLNNFHAPCTTSFELLEYSGYTDDHPTGHYPVCYEDSETKERFRKTISAEQEELMEDIRAYFLELEVAGPRLAHYVGYIVSNKLLPWVEPGYREDYVQTYRYTNDLWKYMGYLPF